MSSSHDQRHDAAWRDFAGRYAVGDVLDGRVTQVVPFGALVEVAGVPGLLAGPAELDAGSTIPVRIATIDAERRRVSVTQP